MKIPKYELDVRHIELHPNIELYPIYPITDWKYDYFNRPVFRKAYVDYLDYILIDHPFIDAKLYSDRKNIRYYSEEVITSPYNLSDEIECSRIFAVSKNRSKGMFPTMGLSSYLKYLMSDAIPYGIDKEGEEEKNKIYLYTKRKREEQDMSIYTDYKSSVTSSVRGVMDRAIESGVEYSVNTLKNHFGKEYLFSYEEDRAIIDSIVNDFVAKLDKKFETRAQRNKQNRYELKNVEFIIPLGKKRKDTFLYVATGNKVGSFESRFMSSRNISENDLKIYIFGKRSRIVIERLEKVITKATMVSNELGIYDISSGITSEDKNGGRNGLHIVYNSLQPRSMDTMYFSNGEKEAIINHITKFKDLYNFYHDRQLLYKTGILFYGVPGTGKSSLVKAIATTFNRSILNISIADFQYIDINKLVQSINTDKEQEYIVLLEDIDTLFLNRETETDTEGRKVINKLLQFLDSNSSPNNVIFIATTNYVDRLDAALLRKGRFDIKVEIKQLNYEGAVEYGRSFGLHDDVIERILKDYIKDRNYHDNEVNSPVSDYKLFTYNQSTLQIDFISNISNKSVEDVSQMYADTNIDNNNEEKHDGDEE